MVSEIFATTILVAANIVFKKSTDHLKLTKNR